MSLPRMRWWFLPLYECLPTKRRAKKPQYGGVAFQQVTVVVETLFVVW
jgi:hypothetical protein